ncbi:MAG: hypothetical protein WDN09_00145 [bacterium]
MRTRTFLILLFPILIALYWIRPQGISIWDISFPRWWLAAATSIFAIILAVRFSGNSFVQNHVVWMIFLLFITVGSFMLVARDAMSIRNEVLRWFVSYWVAAFFAVAIFASLFYVKVFFRGRR